AAWGCEGYCVTNSVNWSAAWPSLPDLSCVRAAANMRSASTLRGPGDTGAGGALTVGGDGLVTGADGALTVGGGGLVTMAGAEPGGGAGGAAGRVSGATGVARKARTAPSASSSEA